MRLIQTFLFLLSVHTATAQTIGSTLDQDPVFTTVLLRRVYYPADAERLGIYAKIYAGFNIDQKGHVQNISVLNPKKIGYGFEEEVIKKIRLLPPLNSKYEGSYALPITFAFVDYSNGSKEVSPTGSLPIQYISNRTLLNELRILGGRTLKQKGIMTPQSNGQVLTTDQ